MIKLIHVDAFANQDFYGNPLAVIVVPSAEHFDSPTMQRIANWLNLSETTFVCSQAGSASYSLRIFTPQQELPFAGHPSIGTAAALFELGLLRSAEGRFTQHCAAGALPVWFEQHADAKHWFVQAPSAQVRLLETVEARALEQICQLSRAAANGVPAVVDNGPKWAVMEFDNAAELLAAKPDFAALGAWNARNNNIGLAAYARAEDELGSYLEVRCFVPLDGIAEDPVTGSGNAAVAAFLYERGAFEAPGLISLNRQIRARQGRAIGRDGHVRLSVQDNGVVAVGGPVRIIARGELSIG